MLPLNQGILDELLNSLYVQMALRVRDGPARTCDEFDTPYTTLINGCVHKEGTMDGSWHANPTMGLWTHFRAGLVEWLNGRDLVVWRTRPKLEEDSVIESDDFMANREAVQDGLASPEHAIYLRPRFKIWCRVSAYRSK